MTSDTTEAATRAAEFLKTVEGFRPTPYKDPAGNRTIGYGFTSAELTGCRRITETEASVELVRICRNLSAMLRTELNGQRLTVAEESALISFIYNVGWSNFKASTMLRLLKEGKRGEAVADEFSRWVYVTKGGRKVACEGLRTRRARERKRFLGGC
ncbi:MAG: lysozyme [Prevotella sp.]|nr:lysozyme [Prevotella sp.]